VGHPIGETKTKDKRNELPVMASDGRSEDTEILPAPIPELLGVLR
jgi:hypothetical protein